MQVICVDMQLQVMIAMLVCSLLEPKWRVWFVITLVEVYWNLWSRNRQDSFTLVPSVRSHSLCHDPRIATGVRKDVRERLESC